MRARERQTWKLVLFHSFSMTYSMSGSTVSLDGEAKSTFAEVP